MSARKFWKIITLASIGTRDINSGLIFLVVVFYVLSDMILNLLHFVRHTQEPHTIDDITDILKKEARVHAIGV